jgi:hypothetical protein
MDAHHSYRFYFMSRDDRLTRSSDADCDGDEQACCLAIEMFGEQDRDAGIEVWDRGRMVFCYP